MTQVIVSMKDTDILLKQNSILSNQQKRQTQQQQDSSLLDAIQKLAHFRRLLFLLNCISTKMDNNQCY